MNLIPLRMFLCRNDVKILIIGTIIGGTLQIISKRYLINHPELLILKDAPVTNEKYSPRGGALVEISGISIKVVGQVVVNLLAKYGFLAGLGSSGVVIVSKIPATAISTYLRHAFPQNLPHLEKSKFILVGGEKIYLDQCDQTLKYLFHILEDETVPFNERRELAYSTLTKYLNLKTSFGRRNFVLCIVFIIYILFNSNQSSFYIMMKSLIEAIRKGKITKSMARLIARKLRKKGIPIDPELAEMIAS